MGSSTRCELRPGGDPISEVKKRLGSLWGHLTKELLKHKKQFEREAHFCQSELTVQLISEPLVLVLVLAVVLFVWGGFGHFYLIAPRIPPGPGRWGVMGGRLDAWTGHRLDEWSCGCS